jgi:hypothetical protein
MCWVETRRIVALMVDLSLQVFQDSPQLSSDTVRSGTPSLPPNRAIAFFRSTTCPFPTSGFRVDLSLRE